MMKQLEADQPQHQSTPSYQQSASPGSTPRQPEATASNYGSSASTASVEHQQPSDLGEPHQYFMAAGPLEEVAPVDADQMNEYQLIKNDLLQSIRYEPTRAVSSGQHSQQQQQQQYQSASTPPMPQMTAGRKNPSNRPSVTRYFHQARPSSSFRPGYGRQHTPIPPMGKTTLGGRKVSEVMRPLIHTTPVPMTSPVHVPSVEPEKLDAIQLIAGRANDRQPLVVESHQLVHHTPEGGIDYNSGAPQMTTLPVLTTPGLSYQTGNSSGAIEHFHTIIHHPPPSSAQPDQPPLEYETQSHSQSPAVIEYVTLSEHALSSALNGQQPRGSNSNGGQTYEIAGQPEMQTLYVNAEQHQQQQSGQDGQQSVSMAPTPVAPFYASGQAEQQQQQHQDPDHHPSLAWSPSVASEHQQQQQQLELNEHAGSMQQLEMPATAGYNNFFNQQPLNEVQQQQQQPQSGAKWRTKAGGSLPNPGEFFTH